MQLEPVHTPQAIERVAALAAEVWPEAFAALLDPAQIDYMVERLQSAAAIAAEIDAGAAYDLIRCDGRDAGYCAVRSDNDPHSMHLSKLYVLAPWRGRGVAAAVLDAVCARAAAGGAQRMTLHVNRRNARALRFYLKSGFEIAATRCEPIGADWVMDDYRLDRVLS